MFGIGEEELDIPPPPSDQTAPKLFALFDQERAELEVGNASLVWQPPAKPMKRTASSIGAAETSSQQTNVDVATLSTTPANLPPAQRQQQQQQQQQQPQLLYAVPVARLYRAGASGPTDLGAAGIAILGSRGGAPSMRSLLFYDSAKNPHLQVCSY
jgi:hypothetical protein